MGGDSGDPNLPGVYPNCVWQTGRQLGRRQPDTKGCRVRGNRLF